MADITMPQLGETVTEGTVTRWLKQVGDQIAQDEPLFEVSTDKVDSEVPSPASGLLTEIIVPEGETVEVGARLAVVSSESGGAASSEAPSTKGAQASAQESAPASMSENGVPEGRAGQTAVKEVKEEPAAPAPQQAAPPPAPEPAPTVSAPTAGGNGTSNGAPPQTNGSGKVLSPVVRRLLSENGLDASQVPGTGMGGRITREDVLSYLKTGAATPAPQAAPPAPQASPGAPSRPAPQAAPAETVLAGERDEVVPFTNIRRRTAEHMVRSKQVSAHTFVAVEVDFENVEMVRRALRESFRAEEGFGLTYLPFITRAVVEAMKAYPHVNASVGEDSLIVHRDLHLGVAVDLDGEGLIVPVVHNAQDKRLRVLAREVSSLASKARQRKLSADDIVGGTFTITNPGPFGTYMTVPIINQPQVAILSTDGVRRRPVVVNLEGGGEAIAVHSTGVVALSFDHRAIDGAYASRFLARLREVIETWDWKQEL